MGMGMLFFAKTFAALLRTSGSEWAIKSFRTSQKLPCFDRLASRCSDLRGRHSTTRIIFLITMEKQSAIVRRMMACSWVRIPKLIKSAWTPELVVFRTTSSRRLRSAIRACCFGDSSDALWVPASTGLSLLAGAVPISQRLNSLRTLTTAPRSRSFPLGAMRDSWCFTSDLERADGFALAVPGASGDAPTRPLLKDGRRAMLRLPLLPACVILTLESGFSSSFSLSASSGSLICTSRLFFCRIRSWSSRSLAWRVLNFSRLLFSSDP
mmetsp:Transcript_8564/g.20563  ORF Transcript_8564/g.20563 Transcript_8564/m.20563 type:complete len:267 (-) Transcript_8564:2305-3105(-)